jgi:aminoglycoside phosphotransferase (APT) family kinase protein
MTATPTTFDRDAREWLARATGIPYDELDIVRLKGSTSSSLFLIRSAHDTSRGRSVLRLIDNSSWLADEPDLAAHEAGALAEVTGRGLRGPSAIAHLENDSPFGAPVVLMSFVDGDVDLPAQPSDSWIEAIAVELASIHRHYADGFGWEYRSWLNRSALAAPDWSPRPELWQQAIEVALQDEPWFQPVFLHRDYHPTNILWSDGSITSVVDWISACRGPAGVDVAHCRTNLVQMYGPSVAERFLELYSAASPGYRHDRYWDIASILDLSLPTLKWYPPWEEFGLQAVAHDLLVERVEEHLASVMGSG